MRTIQDMVSQEVIYCVSSFVSTLASGYGGAIKPHSASELHLADSCEQAANLAAEIPDYAAAAADAGWRQNEDGIWDHKEFGSGWFSESGEDQENVTYSDAQVLCEAEDIDPFAFGIEVYEHWLISEWLADKLEAEGEKVERDLVGMTIWARTTTGQAIYADSVIERIYTTTHTRGEG